MQEAGSGGELNEQPQSVSERQQRLAERHPVAESGADSRRRRQAKSRFDDAGGGEESTERPPVEAPATATADGNGDSSSSELPDGAQPKRQRLESPANGSDRRHGNRQPAGGAGARRSAKPGIVMNLAQKVQEANPLVAVRDASVKEAFADDAEDSVEEEEVPELVRIRMRNLGKYTPTSEGPRSFGKTKTGFTDDRKRHN